MSIERRLSFCCNLINNHYIPFMLFNAWTSHGEPLFSTEHRYICGRVDGVQSNIFRCEIPKDFEKFSELIKEISEKVADFEDENGDVMGYFPDILIIPQNNDELCDLAQRFICTSKRWQLVICQDWNPIKEEFLVLSSEAAGNFWIQDCFSTWKFVAKVIGGEK